MNKQQFYQSVLALVTSKLSYIFNSDECGGALVKSNWAINAKTYSD